MSATRPITIPTILHAYYFNMEKPDERTAYAELCAARTATGVQCFISWGMDFSKNHASTARVLDGCTIEIETAHVFSDQWNTAPIGDSTTGYRVFDWAEDLYENKRIKAGYWIELTDELRAARIERYVCHYCGNQQWKEHLPADGWCDRCIDSPYLKETDLHLLRMRAIAAGRGLVGPLTDDERAILLPRYRAAQIHGSTERGKAAAIKARATVLADCDATIKAATIERDGLIWFLDHGISVENVIYYSHTNRFAIGWRRKLGHEETSHVLDLISEFPFNYTIESETRGKLEN